MRRTVATGLSTEPVLTEHPQRPGAVLSTFLARTHFMLTWSLPGRDQHLFLFYRGGNQGPEKCNLGGLGRMLHSCSQGKARNGLVLRGSTQLSGSPA